MIKKIVIIFSVITLSFSSVLFPLPASASKQDIISDAVFGNEDSMSETQINNFINSFSKSCLKPQNYPSGLSPVTFREPIDYSNYGGNVSPARIIYKSAKLYHLNPQVILATLEKEQNLVTGNAGCAVWKYNSAMGYNCPDGSENSLNNYPNIGVSGTCVKKESNVTFSRQVNHASWQLRFDKERAYGNTGWGGDGAVVYVGFMTQGNRARYAGGPIQYYDGYAIINGQSIKLANGATAALYNYTPHFSNFESIFTSWFGTTHSINIPGCSEATNTSLSCVWRARDNVRNVELVTTDYAVINNYINGRGYSYLGKSFIARNKIAPQSGNIPVYGVTNGPNGETLLTADYNEYTTLRANTNNADLGRLFYADPAGSNTGYDVYRLYNSTTGRHAWTSSAAEKAAYLTSGYIVEGVAFTSLSPVLQVAAPPANKEYVYRFRNMPSNRHFWTNDVYERDQMIRRGYKYDGIGWLANRSAANSVPIYRLYSPTMQKHLYTKDAYEKSVLSKTSSWRYEGIAFYSGQSGSKVYRLYRSQNAEHFYTRDAYERGVLIQKGTFRDEGVGWYQP